MRVLVHPADKGGCGWYRMIFPAQALAAQGHDVILDEDRTYPVVRMGDRAIGLADLRVFRRDYETCVAEVRRAEKRGMDTGPILARWNAELEALVARTGPSQLADADVVVFQRILSRERYETMRAVQAAGAAVVVEIDDDFHAIRARNPAWEALNPLRDSERNRDWLAKACRDADLVTVSTPALATRYGAHGRVVVLPNCVPAAYIDDPQHAYTDTYLRRPAGVLVGWSGSVDTHPEDLEQARGLDLTGAAFHVIGTGRGVKRALALDDEPTATGWLPIEAYPEGLRQLDIGIVPLALHPFNEAKSALKGLELAACGVPFVASPTHEYLRLEAAGVGVCAHTPADWRREVARFVRDPAWREECSITWQAQVRANHTYETNAWRWAEAWESALQHRHARVAA